MVLKLSGVGGRLRLRCQRLATSVHRPSANASGARCAACDRVNNDPTARPNDLRFSRDSAYLEYHFLLQFKQNILYDFTKLFPDLIIPIGSELDIPKVIDRKRKSTGRAINISERHKSHHQNARCITEKDLCWERFFLL